MMHKATLNTLLIYEEIDNQPLIYDEQFVRQILEGKQLEKLTLPLPPKNLRPTITTSSHPSDLGKFSDIRQLRHRLMVQNLAVWNCANGFQLKDVNRIV